MEQNKHTLVSNNKNANASSIEIPFAWRSTTNAHNVEKYADAFSAMWKSFGVVNYLSKLQ